jgi:hypothetical protein
LSTHLHRPAYTLHVELLEIEPPIWRRIEVPASSTLAKLHDVIQLAMGWDDSHMHLFEIGATRYGHGDNEWDEDELDGADYLLGDLGLREGDSFRYTYDFGDDWVHVVTVERIRRDVPEKDVPRLIDGARACPPEDCGGVPGYYELIEALADVDHEEHRAMKRWLGRPWHPESFDVARQDLKLRRRPSSGRARGRDLTPPHMARAGEVLAMMDALRRGVPWLPETVIDLTATLIQNFCLAEPDEFLAVRRPELWLAAGVHAAFMLHPRALLYPLKPLTLQELADLCGVSVASISKRSRQLREGVRVEWA